MAAKITKSKSKDAMDLSKVEPIPDDGVHLYRAGLEAVQYAGFPWERLLVSLPDWGYSTVMFSGYQLPPYETYDGLAKKVKATSKQVEGADGRGPIDVRGYSTHTFLQIWGFAQHPGVMTMFPGDEKTRDKLIGKPKEIEKYMWEEHVQFIPGAVHALGLKGTHTFMPPAVVGGIDGLESAGALVPCYGFTPLTGVPYKTGGVTGTVVESEDLFKDGVRAQANRMAPFLELCADWGVKLWHEMHWDTLSRGPSEYHMTKEIIAQEVGKRLANVYEIGMDTSHAWLGEDFLKNSGPIGSLHSKLLERMGGMPTIIGSSDWKDKDQYFGLAIEDAIKSELVRIALHTDYTTRPTFRGEKPIATIHGKPRYTKGVFGEGESPIVSQVSVANGYGTALGNAANLRFAEGFSVGGTKG